MATIVQKIYSRMITSMGVEGLEIPLTAVKFYRREESLPPPLMDHHPTDITLTNCQATKQASLGDVVCLTRDNIGCVAAAISLGLVDENEERPLDGPRVYTDIMAENAGPDESFVPPAPRDFTAGSVYACRDSGRADFSLFGSEDSGRYKDIETARRAIKGMMAIQPAIMKAVFFYSLDFEEIDLLPDIVLLSVRPVELARIVQAYQYRTGRRVEASMGAVRVVNSDLIVRPYLTQEINVSTYCIGARLIAQYGADRLGIGMPFACWEEVVSGLKESMTGYPFHLYPGAVA